MLPVNDGDKGDTGKTIRGERSPTTALPAEDGVRGQRPTLKKCMGAPRGITWGLQGQRTSAAGRNRQPGEAKLGQ